MESQTVQSPSLAGQTIQSPTLTMAKRRASETVAKIGNYMSFSSLLCNSFEYIFFVPLSIPLHVFFSHHTNLHCFSLSFQEDLLSTSIVAARLGSNTKKQ